MCPAVSGIGSKDAALSGELGLQALHLALGQPESDDVHEPNIVEVTHLCIMHRVHTSCIKPYKSICLLTCLIFFIYTYTKCK
jgi:hypothetical protein